MGAASAIGALIGAGVGGMKNVEEKRQARAQQGLDQEMAEIQPLFSFLTKQKIDPASSVATAPSQLDRFLQGGVMGAQMGTKNQNLFKTQAPVANTQQQSTTMQGFEKRNLFEP